MLEVQQRAALAVRDVLAGRSLNTVLPAALQRQPALNAAQRATLRDAVYGTLRDFGLFDTVIGLLAERPIKDPVLRALLAVALYQLVFGGSGAHAVVDHAVQCAAPLRVGSARGLVNAVLRNFLRRRDALLAQARTTDVGRWSHPQWWIDALRRDHPDHWQGMLETANTHPPMTLRVNRRRTDPARAAAELQAAGLALSRADGHALTLAQPRPVQDVPGFAEGRLSVQDASAQWAATLLDVADGMRVLDACAGPGGKTGHILELADVDLLALDSDADRLAQVGDNLDRLGLAAGLRAADAGAPDTWWDGRFFQRVLVDAPCTGSGVARRHPDIKWLRRPEDSAGFAREQARLLDGVWHALDIGGKLLYATCSIFPEENQAQVADFLKRHDDAAAVPMTAAPLSGGQLVPDEFHDGFFYFLLQKT